MSSKYKTNLAPLILSLLEENTRISLRQIAEAAGISEKDSANRKAIQRRLNELIKTGVAEAKGAARARVYLLKSRDSVAEHTLLQASEKDDSFKSIPLSVKSQTLLRYISKSVDSRTPVSYDGKFLRSYQPNKTTYLSIAQKSELWFMGRSETKERKAGTYARNILNRLLIDLSWNSSRLEGNTYSLLETKRLIELGEGAEGKNTAEAQMILNHKEAIEFIVETAEEKEISSHIVRSVHGLLSENLLGDSTASGRIRDIAVGIELSTYLPLDNRHVLEEYFDMFIAKLNSIKDPFEQSFFALVHLSYLQAFEDVNKRTARLVANIPLIRANLKPLSFMDVNQDAYVAALLGVYEKNDLSLFQDLYIWAYKRSSEKYSAVQQSMAQPSPLKLKYRNEIIAVIRALIVDKVSGRKAVARIKNAVSELALPENISNELFKIIEIEVSSLHDGNIARFKVRPSQFQAWKVLQES
jgi:Fic family protein